MAINRKDFLKTLGGMALFTIVPRRVLGGPGHVAPNDQLTKGIIGMGGIGFSENHFSSSEACRLVAMCDVDSEHLKKGVDLAKSRLTPTSTWSTSPRRPTGTASWPWRPPRRARISGARSP